MIELLKNQFISYLNSRKTNPIPFNATNLNIRTEVISEIHFDIIDKKDTIRQPLNIGSATYHNTKGKAIKFIDYEDFVNQLPDNLQKGIKRCDFIAYDTVNASFFILNELSQSGSPKTKLSDARWQLEKTAFYFLNTPAIKNFIDRYDRKSCIFSNKQKLISTTPNHVADAFSEIQNLLPDPIYHNFHPITKLGFELIETAIVEV